MDFVAAFFEGFATGFGVMAGAIIAVFVTIRLNGTKVTTTPTNTDGE